MMGVEEDKDQKSRGGPFVNLLFCVAFWSYTIDIARSDRFILVGDAWREGEKDEKKERKMRQKGRERER